MVKPFEPPIGGLLGRDQEMTTLVEALEAAAVGSPSTMLVGGDAGIGKTRLITEFAHRSETKLLWGGCLPLGERGVPYLPFIDIIRSLDDSERAALPEALGTLIPSTEGAGGHRAISRAHLFQSLIDFLDTVADPGPLIVVVEDLHWADRSTRDLIDFLIGLLRDQRLLLVGSFRSDDLRTDHPLRPALAEWTKKPSVNRIDLTPLSAEDSLRLITPLLSDLPLDQTLRLVERAEGNPFFLEELAAAGADRSGPPGPLRDLLLRRANDLSSDLLRLLRIASAGTDAIDDDVVSQVAGLDTETTRALLRAGIEAQVLVLDNGRCRFRHALLAEVMHEDLLPAERRDYHAAYADVLGASSNPVPPGELAMHQAEAGRVDDALVAWVAAGETAEKQFAFAEAQQAYQSASALWELAEDPEDLAGFGRVELLRRLAEAAFLAGEAQVACDTARRALSEIDEVADPVTAGLVYHRLARYIRNTDEYSRALALQERAVALVPATPPSPDRAEVLSGLALIHQFENRYHKARDLSLQAIEVAVPTGAVEAEIRARNTLGETICILEDLDRGLSMIDEALDLARRTGNAHEQARALWNMQANRFFGGRMAEFVEHSGSTIATLRVTQPHWIVDHMVDTADALQVLGRWEEADAMLDDARRQFPLLADRIGVPELLVARGELAEARALVESQAVLLVGYIGPDVTGRVWNLVNRAQIELAAGNHAEAIGLIDQALDSYPSLDKPVYISQGLAIGLRSAAEIARAGKPGRDTGAEEAMAAGERFYQGMVERMAFPGPADGWKREVGCLAAQCHAEVARLRGVVDPDAWAQARDQWMALSMPYRAAYCGYRWAEEALASGADKGEVEPGLRELADTLDGMGVSLLGAEVRGLARRARIDLGDRYASNRFGLTDREREVLAQLARGRTNRQIAEELYIGEKTASVHVSNILRKLGAANRGEAAAKALQEGLVDMSELSSGL
jgi:DNA-binding CsgD family transcriptional regulator